MNQPHRKLARRKDTLTRTLENVKKLQSAIAQCSEPPEGPEVPRKKKKGYPEPNEIREQLERRLAANLKHVANLKAKVNVNVNPLTA